MIEVSASQKLIASHIAGALGVVRPPISRYWDDNKESSVFILEAANCPQKGVNSYATVGLSGHPLIRDGSEFPARAEIVGACGAAFHEFGNVLATIAFCIINSKWFCAPGIIFPGVMDMYSDSSTMNDIYFANPFLWKELSRPLRVEEKDIAWLLAIPISRGETEYAAKSGAKALEEQFFSKDIDIYDLNRRPVV